MRSTLHRIGALAGLLMIATLTPRAHAQLLIRPADGSPRLRVVYVPVPGFTSILIQTTVAVPDGGSVNLGGYSQLSEGRNEFGTPGLGKLPYVGRGFRNVGSGRQATSTRVNVRARIIDLREEEYRQTGVRSR
jgi:Flp pilus assembly secretin CpaC